MFNVSITEDLLRKHRELIAYVKSPSMMAAATFAVADELRAWFDTLEREHPNKHGWLRQHFWASVRDSVEVSRPTNGEVEITHPHFRQRLQGGWISPRNQKYLTIPNREEAYGHVARDFPHLRLRSGHNRYGQPCLVLVDKYATDPDDGASPYFYLARKVHQDPDPDVMPFSEDLAGAAARGVENYIDQSYGNLPHARKKL